MPQKTESNVAWFKLAELIARREREKALSIYRLLSHSLDDKAYALQVEADILRSFNIDNAAEKYQQAAFLYTKEKRWVNAVGIYEHLLSYNPQNLEHTVMLVDLYAHLDWPEKCAAYFTSMINILQTISLDDAKVIKMLQQTIKQHQEVPWFAKLLKQHQDLLPAHVQTLLI